MDAYLRVQVSCRLIMIIIRQRKKDIGEIGKIEKSSQKNVYVEIVYNTFILWVCVCVYVCVCLCWLNLSIIVCSRICDR